MIFFNNHRYFKSSYRIVLILVISFVLAGSTSIAQVDSRNQAKPAKEQKQQKPEKTKRIKSKKSPRYKGKKTYSNRKQINKAKRSRAKNVEKSPKGDITGRKFKSKKTPRTTIARPQPDTYKNRRIRTEKRRAGPAAPEVRTATKKGEKARTGDISGRKTVRQRSVKSSRNIPYVQPNPYIGRKIKTEKRRAKSNKREIRSIRSVSRPSESKRPETRGRPVTATVAPKLRVKRNVYRNHERKGGEKSTDKDISGSKLRTKNKRTVRVQTGPRPYASVSPYRGRKRYGEGERFKRSRSLPASARSISRSSESGAYRNNNSYSTRKNFRTPRTTGVVKAKSVRSTSDPSRRGERPIYGKKYRPRPTRSISGQSQANKRRSPGPPVTISGQRKRYSQRNTYRGKDRHFGERSTTKDIAGRNLRTRNYRSTKPNGAVSGFIPYYGRTAPQGVPKSYPSKGGRSLKRGGWNNNGQPIYGKGRNPNQEAASSFRGKMPLSAMPGYGRGGEGAYRGNIPARNLRKYSAGKEGTYSGRLRSAKPLTGGGSISRHWNNNGQPLFGKGRRAYGEAISGYRGKMPMSALPSYGQGGEGSYTGNIPARNIRKYSEGLEGSFSGRLKSRRPLKGGGSITRHWNNKGQPLLGRGRSASGEAISGYRGKMPISALPSYGRGGEGTYAGTIRARKPLSGGGGSITRHWNNKGEPLLGRGRSAIGEAISGYRGKMPMSALPSYGRGGEGTYAGTIRAKKPLSGGGGSITRHWNNKGQPLLGKGRSANGEAISGYRGKMPMSALPSYGRGGEGTYAGTIKAKKPLSGGGGSITRHWNNNGQPLLVKGRSANGEAISGYRGKMPMSAMPSYSGGRESFYRGDIKGHKPKGGFATQNFIGGNKVKERGVPSVNGEDYGIRKKLIFVYFGNEAGYMVAYTKPRKKDGLISPKVRDLMSKKNSVPVKGRTRSLTFLRIGDPTQGGLHREISNTSRNSKLPKELKGADRIRLSSAQGTKRGRTKSLSFINLGNPTRGGLVYSPTQAKGRLHPSSDYTMNARPRNSVEEKEQPIKLRIWWAKLFKKNANQPDQVKNKSRRPRYDKRERLIWETAERPDWYNN